jgi:uncharacterized protein YlxW (UPF0749 family)
MCGRSPIIAQNRQQQAALAQELQQLQQDNSTKAMLVSQLQARLADMREEERQLQQRLDESRRAGASADEG